jgi:hypothetical protein
MVEHNEVPTADVESRKMIHGIFGVEDVLVHNERCSSRLLVVRAPACK